MQIQKFQDALEKRSCPVCECRQVYVRVKSLKGLIWSIRVLNMVKFKTTSKKRKQAEDGIYIGGKARAKILKKSEIAKNLSCDNKEP